MYIYEIKLALLEFKKEYPRLEYTINESTVGGVVDLEAINLVLQLNCGIQIYLTISVFTKGNVKIIGSNVKTNAVFYPILDRHTFKEFMANILEHKY